MHMLKQLTAKYNCMTEGVKASFWFMFCNLFQKGISFITIPIFTRIMTAEEYGSYALFCSWESVLTIFVTLNLSYQVFNNGMVKFSNDKDGYTTSMVGLTFVSFVIWGSIILIFKNWFGTILQLDERYILLLLFDMLFLAVTGLWIVRQRYDFKYKGLSVIAVASSVLNPLLGIILVFNMSDKVLGRCLSIVIANLLIVIITYTELLKCNRKHINLAYWKYALKLDIPLIPHYLSMVLLNNSDRIMIGRFCGGSYTAFYSIANNASMVMNIIVSSINSSFNPWLYQQLKEKNYNKIKEVSRYIVILVAFVSVLPIIFAPEIISILGSTEYMSAVSIMPILACCIFLIYVYTLFSNVEMFFEKTKYTMYGSLSATAINIVLNYIFIQKFGYKAAAYTTFFCYMLLAFFHYKIMKNICKKENVDQDIYDIKVILLLFAFIVCFSIVIKFFLKIFVLRLIIFVGIILLTFLKKEQIIQMFTKSTE